MCLLISVLAYRRYHCKYCDLRTVTLARSSEQLHELWESSTAHPVTFRGCCRAKYRRHILSPRAWPVSNKSPSPKCLLITSVQKNLASQNIAFLHSNCSQLVLHISLVLIWSQVSRTVRSNEVEITKKYRKFDNTSSVGNGGKGCTN